MIAKSKEKKEIANFKASVIFHIFLFTPTHNIEGREELNIKTSVAPLPRAISPSMCFHFTGC